MVTAWEVSSWVIHMLYGSLFVFPELMFTPTKYLPYVCLPTTVPSISSMQWPEGMELRRNRPVESDCVALLTLLHDNVSVTPIRGLSFFESNTRPDRPLPLLRPVEAADYPARSCSLRLLAD